MRCVGAQILLVFWQIGLAFAAIASFHKESSDLQQILHGHIFRVLATHDIIRSRTCFFSLGVSQRPQVPREPTPNELRTNSERTLNELRTSEQAPSELWLCSRANSEHTLAISMFLSPSILITKLFFFCFFVLTKKGQVIRGQFQQVAWEGVF